MTIKLDAGNVDDYHFPVNLHLAQNLLGKMLTHIEAMNLPASAEKANKDLVKQTFWKWWGDVQENSISSYKGCIGPIQKVHDPDGHVYVWRTADNELQRLVDVT